MLLKLFSIISLMKNALVLHGWPQYDIKDYFLCNHLRKLGYKVVTPNLFSEKYTLTIENVLKEVERRLKREKPDLIVGISMGGLIVPFFAGKYPKAKLIIISSGPKLEAKSNGFLLTVKIAQLILGNCLFSFLPKVPSCIVKFFYKLANQFRGYERDREVYEEDTDMNVQCMKRISLAKEKQILDFVTQVDNTNLLRKLKNKTLIFSGEKDLLMTKDGGERLRRLIVNSELVVNTGSHFNTFTEKDLPKINKFICDL